MTVGSDPHRTRRKSPNQYGVRERTFGSLKYEHLYRHEIDDGHQLGLKVEIYRQLFTQIRPHGGMEFPRFRGLGDLTPISWGRDLTPTP